MVGAMAGRGDGFDGKTRALQPFAVGEDGVGRIVAVMGGVEALRPVAGGDERRWPDHLRARRGAELRCAGAVIAMGMGDEDRLDCLALDRVEDRLEMRIVVRSRIDDRDRASADDIGAGAVEGERRGVRRDEAAHQRRKPGQRARRRLARGGYGNGFVVIVGHCPCPSQLRGAAPRYCLNLNFGFRPEEEVPAPMRERCNLRK